MRKRPVEVLGKVAKAVSKAIRVSNPSVNKVAAVKRLLSMGLLVLRESVLKAFANAASSGSLVVRQGRLVKVRLLVQKGLVALVVDLANPVVLPMIPVLPEISARQARVHPVML